jgi:tripeptidyl-peptidase-1
MADTSLAGFYSGAGFSNYFTTPSYQSSVVGSYESEVDGTNSGYYNKSGRAFPDVSAQGSLQEFIISGRVRRGVYL